MHAVCYVLRERSARTAPTQRSPLCAACTQLRHARSWLQRIVGHKEPEQHAGLHTGCRRSGTGRKVRVLDVLHQNRVLRPVSARPAAVWRERSRQVARSCLTKEEAACGALLLHLSTTNQVTAVTSWCVQAHLGHQRTDGSMRESAPVSCDRTASCRLTLRGTTHSTTSTQPGIKFDLKALSDARCGTFTCTGEQLHVCL